MIPLLAFPVLNRPDLLRRAVASIDEPVDRLLVIDNSIVGGMADGLEVPDCVRELWVVEMPDNLGYPASCNFAIRTHPERPWWAIANVDILFAPGDLGRLAALMDDPAPLIGGIVDWRVLAMNAAAVDAVGFLDENYHPCYVEDCDLEYRAKLAGVPMVAIPGETSHVGSVCYADNSNRRFNERSYPANRAYHVAKWGGDIRGGETFTTPFDRGGSIRDWTLDRRRLAELRWRD